MFIIATNSKGKFLLLPDNATINMINKLIILQWLWWAYVPFPSPKMFEFSSVLLPWLWKLQLMVLLQPQEGESSNLWGKIIFQVINWKCRLDFESLCQACFLTVAWVASDDLPFICPHFKNMVRLASVHIFRSFIIDIDVQLQIFHTGCSGLNYD